MSEATLDSLHAGTESIETARIRRRAIISCAVGNFVELFDFLIFGLFAAQIAANFFPNSDPVASLLSTFATYGVGFVMRPVGAVVIGAYGDRRGRKTALILHRRPDGRDARPTGLIPLMPRSASGHRSFSSCADWCRVSRRAANGAAPRHSSSNMPRPLSVA